MTTTTIKEIGERIRYERMKRSIGRDKLARAIGVSPKTFYRYEAGKRKITVGKLLTIAICLRVSIDTLLPNEREKGARS